MKVKNNKMKIHHNLGFATLFDYGYLSRGYALYQSISKYCISDFGMYILALDKHTFSFLSDLDEIQVVSLEEVMDLYPILKVLKEERTYQEFCWTLASFFTQYVMRVFEPNICIYVDSDVLFWDDPCILINEMLCEEKSVLITEHNYYYKYDQTETSGKYCVQFMPFVNNSNGNHVLEWWRQKCEEKCSSKIDGITFGDQKYLDDWESRFHDMVYNCRNIGSGIAPWNCQKFSVYEDQGKKIIIDKTTRVSGKLIFFHYHALQALSDSSWNIAGYSISEDFKEFIYKPYINIIKSIESCLDHDNGIKYPVHKLVNKYLFYPVPYQKEQHVDITYLKDTKTSYVVKVIIEGTKDKSVNINIDELKDGTLRIVNVDDSLLFSKYLHEIVWQIQLRVQFGAENVYDTSYKVLKSIKENHHFKLEWIIGSEEELEFDHPIYDKSEMVLIVEQNRLLPIRSIYKPN